jgi:hypothetical protein
MYIHIYIYILEEGPPLEKLTRFYWVVSLTLPADFNTKLKNIDAQFGGMDSSLRCLEHMEQQARTPRGEHGVEGIGGVGY